MKTLEWHVATVVSVIECMDYLPGHDKDRFLINFVYINGRQDHRFSPVAFEENAFALMVSAGKYNTNLLKPLDEFPMFFEKKAFFDHSKNGGVTFNTIFEWRYKITKDQVRHGDIMKVLVAS